MGTFGKEKKGKKQKGNTLYSKVYQWYNNREAAQTNFKKHTIKNLF